MISVKETNLYEEVIKELNYSFGNAYIFEGFVVAEANEGVIFTWDNHGKHIVDDVIDYFGSKEKLKDLVYISNRVHSFSVVATDWLKFFKHSYSLKAYCIISESKIGVLNSMIENLFFSNKIKRFNSLYTAVNWIKSGLIEIT